MTFISKILYDWHSFRMNYHYMLVDSCLDSELKSTLIKKAEYHQLKLEKFIKSKSESFY